MYNIHRRLAKMEKKLSIDDERSGMFIASEHNYKELPEPVEEWITYKEAKVRCGQLGIFMADPAAEFEAGEQQKATESNKKAKK
jgi:hypothetical protein